MTTAEKRNAAIDYLVYCSQFGFGTFINEYNLIKNNESVKNTDLLGDVWHKMCEFYGKKMREFYENTAVSEQ